MSKQKPKRCLACRKEETFTRGLCRKCYQNGRNMIARGETTEAEMIEKKILLPSRQGMNAVREALTRS